MSPGGFQSNRGNVVGVIGRSTGFEHDLFGTETNPLNPKLGPLTDNGGPTQTHGLFPESPAVSAGKSLRSGRSHPTEAQDQRGFDRPPPVAIVPQFNSSGLHVPPPHGFFESNGQLFFAAVEEETGSRTLATRSLNRRNGSGKRHTSGPGRFASQSLGGMRRAAVISPPTMDILAGNSGCTTRSPRSWKSSPISGRVQWLGSSMADGV